MNSVCIIVPIFNPAGDRFNNFCFILKKLYEQIDICEIVVAEQTSENPNVQKFLQKYHKIKHISMDLGEVFNKSKLINGAVTQTESEYIWLVDADFYTDYGYVLSVVDTFEDFTRPFNKTIMLDETETDALQELGYITIGRNEYESNSAPGKYSFIVRRCIFTKSGMLNEDFIGWGFQDLDFMKNRLVECEQTFVDCLGFHLYHEPASKQYVNRNKRLFLNISPEETLVKNKTELNQQNDLLVVHKSKPKVRNVEEKPKNGEGIKVKEKPVSVKSEPVHIHPKQVKHIHQKVRESTLFPASENTIIIDDSEKRSKRRGLSGKIETTTTSPHFTEVYIKYIIQHYHELNGVCVFSTDLFSTTSSIFGHDEIKKVRKCVDDGFLNFNGFAWITTQSPLRFRHGHATLTSEKSKYDYNAWVRLYTKTEPRTAPKYSLAGSFAVDASCIKKHDVEYYERILSQSHTWTEEDYLFLMSSLSNIFA
jgi:hypothetical protein